MLKLTCDYNNLQLYVDHLWALYTFKLKIKTQCYLHCMHAYTVYKYVDSLLRTI